MTLEFHDEKRRRLPLLLDAILVLGPMLVVILWRSERTLPLVGVYHCLVIGGIAIALLGDKWTSTAKAAAKSAVAGLLLVDILLLMAYFFLKMITSQLGITVGSGGP
jgi:hypothetical protein